MNDRLTNADVRVLLSAGSRLYAGTAGRVAFSGVFQRILESSAAADRNTSGFPSVCDAHYVDLYPFQSKLSWSRKTAAQAGQLVADRGGVDHKEHVLAW